LPVAVKRIRLLPRTRLLSQITVKRRGLVRFGTVQSSARFQPNKLGAGSRDKRSTRRVAALTAAVVVVLGVSSTRRPSQAQQAGPVAPTRGMAQGFGRRTRSYSRCRRTGRRSLPTTSASTLCVGRRSVALNRLERRRSGRLPAKVRLPSR
jgi:hypothetical protein